ncbi:MAG: type IV pilus twitching motility protein PilT [Gemmatimonadaceae bacterium]|jgi:twitching motility protein PilT|nr:type IV pilus twitching motility protein PilT [Gemmatimonadaceae bacterium]
MSASLDSILHLLHSRHMDDVLLRDGDPVYLRRDGQMQPVTRQPLGRGQIEALLEQVAQVPPEQAVDVTVHEPSFDGRPFAVIMRRRQSDQQVTPATLDRRQSAPGEGNEGGQMRRGGESVGGQWSASHHPGRRASDRAWGPFCSRQAALEALERLLRRQVEVGAADLHLRVGEPPVVRVGGDLQRLAEEAPLTDEQLTALVTAAMPKRNEDEFRERSDTDFAHEIVGLSRFRANVLKDRNGTAAVFRTIAAETVTVEQMGISPEVQQLCALSKGLVLVTGPTGSGKSTTLCALVDLINRTRNDHIITIEDPIEFVHQNKRCLITQRQVGVHTQSFKSALRAALREDPDVVLVGELRDLETVAIAIETAETGHLVLGTLHTATAAGTIDRIIDQFPADRQEQIRVMLAESLKGVVSQTLLKRVGGGRVAAREVLLVNTAVANLIREGKTVQIPSIMQTNKRLGMVLLNDALMDLVNAGEVEPLEAYLKAVDKASLAERLKAKGHDVIALQRQRDLQAA